METFTVNINFITNKTNSLGHAVKAGHRTSVFVNQKFCPYRYAYCIRDAYKTLSFYIFKSCEITLTVAFAPDSQKKKNKKVSA
jgi:hypothetical protein